MDKRASTTENKYTSTTDDHQDTSRKYLDRQPITKKYLVEQPITTQYLDRQLIASKHVPPTNHSNIKPPGEVVEPTTGLIKVGQNTTRESHPEQPNTHTGRTTHAATTVHLNGTSSIETTDSSDNGKVAIRRSMEAPEMEQTQAVTGPTIKGETRRSMEVPPAARPPAARKSVTLDVKNGYHEETPRTMNGRFCEAVNNRENKPRPSETIPNKENRSRPSEIIPIKERGGRTSEMIRFKEHGPRSSVAIPVKERGARTSETRPFKEHAARPSETISFKEHGARSSETIPINENGARISEERKVRASETRPIKINDPKPGEISFKEHGAKTSDKIPTKAVSVKRRTAARRTQSMADLSPGRKSHAPSPPRRQAVVLDNALPLMPVQMFDYFLVVNFQATCDVHSKPQPQPREIMEFSLTKVNGQTFSIEAQFHQYVSPRINKKLSKFCTQLTGISQCMVDGQPGLEPTMKKLHVWLYEQGLYQPGITFAVVSHGDWDLQQLLPKNVTATSGSALPAYFRKWIDVSKIFKIRTGTDPSDELDELNGMLKAFDMNFEGPRHCGIYVCYNVVQLMRALAAQKQCVFSINSP